tara:strand:- start:778 stop:1770 length:993 start_codon:yes stop_codon:yes gene_type:complete
MAITHFEILELPDENIVISEISATPLLIDTRYAITDQSNVNFKRIALLDEFYVKAPFKWRAINDVSETIGSETVSYLEWKSIIEDSPESVSVVKTVLNSFTESLLDAFPINGTVEVIEIVSLSGVPSLVFNGSNVYVGQIINVQDLFYAIYTVGVTGGGLPYFSMTYKVGQFNAIEPAIYTYELNVDSLAEIAADGVEFVTEYSDTFDDGGIPTVYPVKNQSLFIDITKGSSLGIANIDVVILSPYLALNVWNNIIVNINGSETQYTIDGTINLNVKLDVNGEGIIKISNIIVVDAVGPKTGQIDVNLINIDGNPALVSVTNTVQLITNL